MRYWKKSEAALASIVLMLALAGVQISCEDSDLAKVTDGITIGANALKAVKDFQKQHAAAKETAIKADFAAGKLTKEAANALWVEYSKDATVAVDIQIALNQAMFEVNEYVKSLVKLDPAARTDLKNLLRPLIDGFIHALDIELPRIKNPELKAAIRSYLTKGRDALEIVFALIGRQ
jgi:head-tail adaptor